MPPSKLKEQLLALIDDYRDFNSAPIEVRPIPTAIEFATQVSKGYPCIYQAYTKTRDVTGKSHIKTDPALLQYPAFTWTRRDLSNLIREKIEVAVTPNGRADDLQYIDGQEEPVFLAPATIEMTIDELLDKLCAPPRPSQSEAIGPPPRPRADPVYYLQSQNSNLTTPPFSRIVKHVPESFPFATPVLSAPEAINLWIGDDRSVTSTHRDPYENLYLVLKGTKTFTLYPPVDELTLPTRFVRTGSYTFDRATDAFSTVLDDDDASKIPWVTIDPQHPRANVVAQHPLYARSSPRTVAVREGQLLYLPAGWFHHVRQECGAWNGDGDGDRGEDGNGHDDDRAPCVAVNYWYDMEYEGEKYVMRQLLTRLKALMQEEEGEGAGTG